MKLRYKVIISLMMLMLSGILLIYASVYGYCDQYIKMSLEYYLSNSVFKTQIKNLHIKDNLVAIDKISSISQDNLMLEINDVKMHVIFQSNSIIINTEIPDGNVNTDIGESIKFRGSINYYINLPSFKSGAKVELNTTKAVTAIASNSTLRGNVTCLYNQLTSDSSKNVDCNIRFDDNLEISTNNKIIGQRIISHSSIQNISLMFYQVLKPFFKENKLYIFLDEYIKAGDITSGQLYLDIHKNSSIAPVIEGKFDVRDIEFKYSNDFVPLKRVHLDVDIKKSLLQILLTQAYVGRTLISEGIISLDFSTPQTATVLVDAKGIGPISDLVSFISQDTLATLKNYEIDLSKIVGNANSVIKISIPLQPKIANTYNISTDIIGANLNIFNDLVKCKDLKIQGLFDGDSVSLTGNGKVGDFYSAFTYKYDLMKKDAAESFFNAKVNLSGDGTKLGFAKLLSGEALLNIEYQHNNNLSTIHATSNLKNLEFYLDKIAIHKIKGTNAKLDIETNLRDNTINFKLIGDNNLKLLGTAQILGSQKYKIKLPTIQHYDDFMKADISTGPNHFAANIKATQLDLSNADMIAFLKKNRENSDTVLNASIDHVRLKNNVNLDNVKLNLRCDKIKCITGVLDANIKDKFLTMQLKSLDDNEEWTIFSNDAGSVLSGVGIFDKMRSGSMLLKLNTSRSHAIVGEIIPILNGTFVFKKFTVFKIPFLTRIVSFISLPGFVSVITNNKDIAFTQMSGKFNYRNNLIRIIDSNADGPFFDFTTTGNIDTASRSIKLKGRIVPSLYGINTIVKHLPVIGNILSGGHRKGVVSAPYSIIEKY